MHDHGVAKCFSYLFYVCALKYLWVVIFLNLMYQKASKQTNKHTPHTHTTPHTPFRADPNPYLSVPIQQNAFFIH